MPNWCENVLTVKGHPHRVIDFIEYGFDISKNGEDTVLGENSYVLNFEKIEPTPKNEIGELMDDWYEWRLEHWGTKWDAIVFHQLFDAKFKNDGPSLLVKDKNITLDYLKEVMNDLDTNYETSIKIVFNTAWCYPLKLYEKIISDFEGTDLEFTYEYFEGGCGFGGEATWKEKVCLHEYEVDSEEPFTYYKYILNKGLESFDFMLEMLYMSLEEYFGHLGRDIVDNIYETVEKRLDDLSEFKIDAFVRLYVRLLGFVVENDKCPYSNVSELIKEKTKKLKGIS